ncbi:6460_t:CDS:2 [Acaulospora colombiana]|uniref:6460_t:CDS:1 n=1 Tax=Acaulospora colombiana TaxID=27376 RepID=A0ACA9LZP3_9GLOM|nr:6460_t:CDS:2 [Acaulospora colombiana]
MNSTFFGNLSQNFLSLLEKNDEHNVIIETGEDSHPFRAHTSVLCCRCPQLYDELKNVKENTKNIRIVKKPNISTKVFDIVIKDDLTLLQNFYNDIILRKPEVIFDSGDFKKLDEATLASILKRDDLQLEETKIWNHLIEWGIARTPDLPEDVNKWKNKDFDALKERLKLCLPHIRFFQIPIENISPYKQILDPQLWIDIWSKSNMVPDLQIVSSILPPRNILSKQTLVENVSNIMTNEHIAEIASWIDKKESPYKITENPYELKLLLRKDGKNFSINDFWKSCNREQNLIVILKVRETNEILGGYNPIGWSIPSDDWHYAKTYGSFIFSLKNGNMKRSILSKVKHAKAAIINNRDYGPRFGATDLSMYVGPRRELLYFCRQQNYEKPIRNSAQNFDISHIEVFKISKNSRTETSNKLCA